MAKIDTKGLFDDLATTSPAQKPSTFTGYFDDVQSNAVDQKLGITIPETNFAKVNRYKAEAEEAEKASKKANSLGTLAVETVKGLPKAAFNIADQVVRDPVNSAYQAALGLANGLTLGATDWMQRKAFISEAKKSGMDEKTASSMAESILRPSDPELAAIRGGADFAGVVVPYAGAEKLMMSGLKYAAPAFVMKYGKAAKLLADIGVFNTVGQVNESFKPEDERDRSTRALIDTGAAATFFLGGEVFRALRGTKFKSPFGVAPVQGAAPTSEKQIVDDVSKNLLAQVKYNNKDLGAILSKVDVSGAQTLDDLARAYTEAVPVAMRTPENLAHINNWIQTGHTMIKEYADRALTATPGATGLEGSATKSFFEDGVTYSAADLKKLRGDAKTAVTIKTGAPAEKAGVEATEKTAVDAAAKGKDVTVITNDLPALQNYIKGSNDITYKKITTLGVDANGEKILARHEFNPKTGEHIIYSTDDATASTLAHELGHYFDKSLTESTDGLARLLPQFEKYRVEIEDTLGSLAVQRLGGEATGKQISAEVRSIANSIVKEAEALSALRRSGTAAGTPSENFADAVSEILTKASAREQAPVLTQLIRNAQENGTAEIIGKAVGKEIKIPKSFTAPKEAPLAPKVEAPKKFDIVQDKALGRVAVPRVGDEVSVNGKNVVIKKITQTKDGEFRLSTYDSVTRKRASVPLSKVDNIGTLQGMAKNAQPKTRVLVVKPTREGKIKEVTKQLDRTPTGKVPDTIPMRAEKITADQETETFLNTKVLPKITGKERIGKSNEDIVTRSLSSKMTEKEWNNILNERVGNLAEDVTKAKRIINDRVQGLRDNLAGRDISALSGSELKEITMDYEKLVETVEVFAGVRTELSNAFRSLGIEVVPGENDVLRGVVEQMQRVLGKEGDNFTFLQKALKLRENDAVDKYFSIWYPAILSGPKTTARNLVGTGTQLITETLSQLFTKEGRTSFTDRVGAMVGASKEAWNRSKDILSGKEKIVSKFNDAPPLREPDFKGKFAFLNNVQYVGRFLDAQDAYFSSIAKEGEIAALRKGEYTYGLTDKEIIKELNDSVASAYSQRVTYRNPFDKTIVGETGRFVTALKQSDIQALKAVSNFLIPFVRTIANVTDRKIDYIPILNMARVAKNGKFIQTRAVKIVANAGLRGAEAERVTQIVAQRLQHQQLGKMYMGMTVLAGMLPMAMAGRITGAGPKNKNERDTLMLKGWRPQSLILPGGVVLPYQNLGPLAGILSLMGNIHDGIKYDGADDSSVMDLVGVGIQKFMTGELDQSFMAGFSNIYDMLSPYSYRPASDIMRDMAASAIPIPAAWTQTKDILFPQRFEARSFEESILNKVGFTSGLEPKLDAFGKPMYADMIWGLTPRVLNTDDPVLNWMDENEIFIGKPNRKQTIKGRAGAERDMTPEEYTQYLGTTGTAIYDKINSYIDSGRLERYNQEQKKKIIEGIVRDVREKVKGDITF